MMRFYKIKKLIMSSECIRMPKRPSEMQNASPSKHVKVGSESECLEQKFAKLQSQYLNDGIPQQTQLFLRRMARAAEIPVEIKQMPLLRMLTEICVDLMMNDLELSLWSLILEKIQWIDTLSLPWVLICTAFAAKQHFNLDVSIFEHHIATKYTDFQRCFQNWQNSHQETRSINAKTINARYVSLSLPISPNENGLFDYNYYVDDILHVSPPSNLVEVQTKIEAPPSDSEEIKLPELMTLNSVLVIDQKTDLNEPSYGRFVDNPQHMEEIDFDDPFKTDSPTKFLFSKYESDR
ncbi:unnamed protein product [Blepharisma stoltei]|uniref:Uncharacterized protein n=1 Tax=Blepharisma stoltei TaxID=1481888 RepID=A0AAU9IQJ6_9CILI|nr:unnamed protein product [Blepharisma stoltei]